MALTKYQDALPLYRQETILKPIGVDLRRATLANWMIQAGSLVQPLINLLRDRLLAYDILQMDETPVQVLKEPGKTARSKSYLWLQRGGPPDQPVNGLTHVGCMAHARRKFSEAVKAQGKNKERGKAHRGLALIQKLYRVEKQARTLTPKDRYAHRQRHARPILSDGAFCYAPACYFQNRYPIQTAHAIAITYQTGAKYF